MTTDHVVEGVALDDVRSWIDLYVTASEQEAEAAERKRVARQRIEEALGDAETGTVDGRPVVRWTHVTSKRLDQAKAKEALTTLGVLDQVMVESTSRRFTLVTDEEATS